MNTKRLAEAAMMSAAFVVLTIVLIGSGLGYLGYIDFVVPILIVLIYFRCGLKYTVLSSFTCLLLIVFAIGDVSSAILMSQSMIYGIICAYLIPSSFNIMDDIFYGSVLSCIAMLVINFNFSNLLGYNIIEQCRESMEEVLSIVSYMGQNPPLSKGYLNTIFYLSIISLPVGIMLITYIFSIILGSRFKFLKENSKKKYKIIRYFKKYGSLISCSKKTVIIAIGCIVTGNILKIIPVINKLSYIEILINSVVYVCYFFLIQDSISVINKGMYILFSSRIVLLLSQLFMLMGIIKHFHISFALIVAGGICMDFVFKIKYKAELYLSQYV